MKKPVSIILALLLALLLPSPAFADSEAPFTGSFTTSTGVQISSISVYEAGTLNVPAYLVPTQVYDVKVVVSDAETIDDLSSLVVKIYYSSSGDPANATEANFDALPVDDSREDEQFIWLKEAPGVVNKSNAGSWALTGALLPVEFSATSFEFTFSVKIGEVARETPSSDRWQIAAKVTDSTASTAVKFFSADAGVSYGLPMNWYGNVSLPATVVDWGTVVQGMGFSNPNAKRALGVPVTYTSNGRYERGIKSATLWTHSLDGGKAVVLSGGLTPGDTDKFVLAASSADLDNTVEDLSGLVLNPDGSTKSLGTSDVPTPEGGTQVDSNHLYLSLSDNITAPGTYAGSMYYVISYVPGGF